MGSRYVPFLFGNVGGLLTAIQMVFKVLVALERGSRGRIHPVVSVRLLNRFDDEDSARTRSWLVAGVDLEVGLIRGFTAALEQWQSQRKHGFCAGSARILIGRPRRVEMTREQRPR